MTPDQSRMARAALKWSIDDLHKNAKIGRMTVVRFERGETVNAESVVAMQEALEQAGATFSRRSGRVGVSVSESGA
jgi:transcriptional regulator with XRE-family HTH domain